MHPIFRSPACLAIVLAFLTMSIIPRVTPRYTENLAHSGDEEELKAGTGKDKVSNTGNQTDVVASSGNDTNTASAEPPLDMAMMPMTMTCGSVYSDCLGAIKAPMTPVEGTDVEQVFLDTLKCSAEYYHCRQNATQSQIGNKSFTTITLELESKA